MRYRGRALVALPACLVVGLPLTGCTAPPPTRDPAVTPTATRSSRPNATSTAHATSNQYTLKLEPRHADDLAYTLVRDNTENSDSFRPVVTGRRYVLRAACVFGVDDTSTVSATRRQVGEQLPPALAQLALPCDGTVHGRTVSFSGKEKVQVNFDQVGPKMRAWSDLRPR